MQPEKSSQILAKAEDLTKRLEAIELSPVYINAMEKIGQFQKDNFEMIDRALSMMQAVHKVELQNTNFYVDMLKFLIPIFATAAIAGATVDTQGINSLLLEAIGLGGIIGGILTLAPLLVKRHHKTKEQSQQYIKLADALDKWQKVAKLREQLDIDQDFNSHEARLLLDEIMNFAGMIEEAEK